MTMAASIAPPGQTDTRSANADWMELQALRSTNGCSSIYDLFGVLDIIEDSAATDFLVDYGIDEQDDESILETARNRLGDAVLDELEHRKRILGDTYPFFVKAYPPGLERTGDVASVPGRVVYLFCLLASAIRENKVQSAKLTNDVRSGIADVFQVCACLAAGGYIAGEVVSFGFPRVMRSGFLPALRAAYERFGAGTVKQNVPSGFPTSTKDSGIDVIAWKDHPDRMPGKLYLLGQCASGVGWREKSVVAYIPQFHAWFSEQPAAHCLPSIFIPFALHGNLSDDPGTLFNDVLARKFLFYERRYGIVFDRFRVAYFAGACIRAYEDGLTDVDGCDRFREVRIWVDAVLDVLGLMESA